MSLSNLRAVHNNTAKDSCLRYLRQSRDSSLVDAEDETQCVVDLLVDINRQSDSSSLVSSNAKDTQHWRDMLLEWTREVREKFRSSLDHDEMVYLSTEDFQLINMDCATNEQEASLLPIVQYFEDTGSHEWEGAYIEPLRRVIHKKKLYDFNRHHLALAHHLQVEDMKQFFTAMELKLLNLISDSEDYKCLMVAENRFQIDICRVCCHHKPNAMVNIFSAACTADGLSFATKIGVCADVAIEEHDTLPKSICRDCIDNLKTCYEFLTLCRESDVELRRDKTLRDMIMEQVLDKTMGCIGDSSGWSNPASDAEKTDWNEAPSRDTNCVDIRQQAESQMDTTIALGRPSPSSSSSGADGNCDIRKFQCELCGARFFDIYNFKTHWRIHTIVKKYECQAVGCGKKFRTNVMLKIHLRTHTGERPYSCQTCYKKFKTASAVTSHQAVHATVKAFKCDLCPYQGTTKPNLRIHQRTHSKEQPYACPQCGKRFSTASNLLKHSRNIHQRLKTNKCPVCEKRFFSRESCRKHLITHTDSKPYDCKHCPPASVAYSWYSGLEKHYQKHHKRFRMPAESAFKGRVEKALCGAMTVDTEVDRPVIPEEDVVAEL